MAIDLSPEQRDLGKANFERAVGEQYELNRRQFMKGLLAAGAAFPIGAAAYFGYERFRDGKPVKAGLIGAGDEGGVLVGEHNPEYLEFIAYSDIRPSNQKRIFDGEPTGPRKGFNRIYGKESSKKIRLYDNYRELLENKDIEAVVIALPLHLHAQASIDAMRAGKHVLCEKLMAWNIAQCKEMIKVAEETDRILSIGHQRHYSMLYAHAVELLYSGALGEVAHIDALWHRNNTFPRLDKDGKEIRENGKLVLRDGWRPEIKKEDRDALESRIRQLGYKSMEELVRWRLYNRTGGGLMAELGSHQLDACSIFLGKVHPLAVTGIGGKYFYEDDREVEDHVFCTFEFPDKNYFKRDNNGRILNEIQDPNDIVVVTYSSISTNAFEPYGECVKGTRGTMMVEQEQRVLYYPVEGAGRPTTATVTTTSATRPVVDSSSSPTAGGDRKALETGQAALGPVSRGYREEMEDFAYCIRMWEQGAVEEKDRPKDAKGRPIPRCHGRVAMADAIVALTANIAMRGRPESGNRPERIDFQPAWFDPASPAVPDGHMKVEVVL
jgi:predicted dehydrogenase